PAHRRARSISAARTKNRAGELPWAGVVCWTPCDQRGSAMSALAVLSRLPARTTLYTVSLDRLRSGWMVPPLVIVGVTCLTVLAVASLANIALPSRSGDSLYYAVPTNVFLDVWARCDSAWYMTIARGGYTYTPGELRDVAFFPLSPLMMRVTSSIAGNA